MEGAKETGDDNNIVVRKRALYDSRKEKKIMEKATYLAIGFTCR